MRRCVSRTVVGELGQADNVVGEPGRAVSVVRSGQPDHVNHQRSLIGSGVHNWRENKTIEDKRIANMEKEMFVETEEVARYKNDFGEHSDGDLGGSSVLVGSASSDIVGHDCDHGGAGNVLVSSASSDIVDRDTCFVERREYFDHGRGRALGGHAIETIRSKRGNNPVKMIKVKIEDQYDRAFKSWLEFPTTRRLKDYQHELNRLPSQQNCDTWLVESGIEIRG